ncbi:MAG: signal peptide peptidase SppA [Caulobacteraceae bacterium]
MKHFLITVAGVVVGLVLFTLALPFVVVALAEAAARPAPMAARSVLVLDLRRGLTDQEAQTPLAFITGRSLSVIGIEDALRRAGGDGRVRGLLVRLPDGGMAPAAADELRLAFGGFRAAGKPILVFSQGIYGVGPAASTYALAAASGDVWMQNAASFQATGMGRQDLFFKRFFDRYGIVADFQQRYEYKNAVNPYLYSDYTPAHREGELSWIGSVYSTALAQIAADRRLAPAELQSIIETGPYSAEDARTKGLIDRVGDLRAAEKDILGKAGDGAKLMDFAAYARAEDGPSAPAGAPIVAVIFGEGAIVTGEEGAPSPLGGGQSMRADAIARSFYRAVDDKDVKAIVFRVSSPGGSDTASEEIASAVGAAVKAGKPVVVSMGTYGASGGYWISAPASRIVAEPTTLTGSIGVFGGKFALGPALAKFGVDARALKVGGDFTGAYSMAAPMDPGQRAAYSKMLDRIYQVFVQRVAQGRRLPLDKVEAIAKGRVWTGVQAKGLGLVDEIGGFYQAVNDAKSLAGIRGAARLQPFNVQVSPFQEVARMLGGGVETARTLSAAAYLAGDPAAQNLLLDLRDARLRSQGATVLSSARF